MQRIHSLSRPPVKIQQWRLMYIYIHMRVILWRFFYCFPPKAQLLFSLKRINSWPWIKSANFRKNHLVPLAEARPEIFSYVQLTRGSSFYFPRISPLICCKSQVQRPIIYIVSAALVSATANLQEPTFHFVVFNRDWGLACAIFQYHRRYCEAE